MLFKAGQPDIFMITKASDAELQETPNDESVRRPGRAVGRGRAVGYKRRSRRALSVGEARSEADDAFRAALVDRVAVVVERELSQMSFPEAQSLALLPDHIMLSRLAEHSLSSPIDLKNRMALKGEERFREMLDRVGGAASLASVVNLLGTTEDAVRKHAERNTILAYRTPRREWSFPVFQFDQNKGVVYPGVKAFLKLTKDSDWPAEEKTRFLLVPYDPQLPGHETETPLDLLVDGQVERVMRMADRYLQQED